jgi:NhaC family Na+:H+ antiporter
MKKKEKKPGLLLSLVPVVILVVILAVGVVIFGEDVTSGPSQIALVTAAIVACLIGMLYLKVPWARFGDAMGDNMSKTSEAIFILLMIGALTSTWMLSGVVPTMIYYGLKLIHPSIFLLVTFLLCSIISIMAGSSWTTVGTIGVAMLHAGQIVGIPTGWLAGAIISGAYLGDKISPLSDTTNLAASVAGVDLHETYS